MKLDIYVDGSFNKDTKEYGAGVVVLEDGAISVQNGFKGNDPLYVKHRNVAGEVYAAQIALAYCAQQLKERSIDPSNMEVTIYYDYAGLECWVTGAWRAQNTMSIGYVNFVRGLPFKVRFQKVRAHTGVVYNEQADQWAKAAVGL